jgi:hypothetical protein
LKKPPPKICKPLINFPKTSNPCQCEKIGSRKEDHYLGLTEGQGFMIFALGGGPWFICYGQHEWRHPMLSPDLLYPNSEPGSVFGRQAIFSFLPPRKDLLKKLDSFPNLSVFFPFAAMRLYLDLFPGFSLNRTHIRKT